jgi:hypothetical protein
MTVLAKRAHSLPAGRMPGRRVVLPLAALMLLALALVGVDLA